jgi:hypothetical protein
MNQFRVVLPIALLLAALSLSFVAQAQNPTAVQRMQLSAFGGVSGVFTGLEEGKNFSLTLGADLALPPFSRLVRPVIEVRATQPTDHGLVDSQKSILGGLRVDFLLGHRIHPYADFLFGRGQMNYGEFGYLYNNFEYDLTTTNVYSPGVGFDYDLSERFALKADGQYQQWSSAPTPSGTIYAKSGTLGLVYRFNFNRHAVR